jgi:3-methyladenine DNA glycosylase AlkD
MKATHIINEFKKRSRPLTPEELKADQRFSPTKLSVRKISKTDYQYLLKTYLSQLEEHEQARLWLDVYQQSTFRNLDSIVIDFFKMRSKKKTFDFSSYGDDIYKMVPKIDCWMTGDMLANMTALLHEQQPKKYAPTIEKWSKSKSPWLHRMALLSLFYYSRCRTIYPSFEHSIQLLTRHLDSDHYYVQKSVGWTLRELHNVYPAQTKAFLSDQILNLSSHAFITACEKIKGKIKDQWKQQRSLARKN